VRWWSGECCHGDRSISTNIGKVMGNTLPCGGNQGKLEGVTNPSLLRVGLFRIPVEFSPESPS